MPLRRRFRLMPTMLLIFYADVSLMPPDISSADYYFDDAAA